MRRKGKYVNETFLRRKDAEEWALGVERRIDRGEPSVARRSREAKSFGDLVRLHQEDLQEVGKRVGRSKAASLALLERKLGRLRLPELSRDRLIQFGKERAREGAGPVTVAIDLGYIKTILSHAAAVHGVVLSMEAVVLARIALARLGLVGKARNATAARPRVSLTPHCGIRGQSATTDSFGSNCKIRRCHGYASRRYLHDRMGRFRTREQDAARPGPEGPTSKKRKQSAHPASRRLRL